MVCIFVSHVFSHVFSYKHFLLIMLPVFFEWNSQKIQQLMSLNPKMQTPTVIGGRVIRRVQPRLQVYVWGDLSTNEISFVFLSHAFCGHNDKMVFSKKSFVYSHDLSVFKERKKKTNLIEIMTKNTNDVNIYIWS